MQVEIFSLLAPVSGGLGLFGSYVMLGLQVCAFLPTVLARSWFESSSSWDDSFDVSSRRLLLNSFK